MTAGPLWWEVDEEDDDPPARPLAAILHSRRYTTVRLVGEHDIANEQALSGLIASAWIDNDADLVVDLGDVEYLSASTIHVIERAREDLATQNRSLTLRSPSPIARRLLDLLDLDYGAQPAPLQLLLSEPI